MARLVTLTLVLALASATAQAGLIDHWDFEEGSGGTTADSAVGAHTGTLGTGASWDTAVFHPGLSGSTASINFDGTNDARVQMLGYKGTAGIAGTSSRTITAWVRTTTDTPADQNISILSYGRDTAEQKWITRATSQNTTQVPAGQLRTEVNGGYIVGTTQITDGAWHHIAVVLNNDGTPNVNELSLYVDGKLEVVDTSLAKAINTNITNAASINVLIGDGHSNREWNGWIDDVRIYDNALQASEVAGIAVVTPTIGWKADGLSNGSLTDWDPDVNTTAATTVDWNGTGTKQSGNSNFVGVKNWVNSPNYKLGEDAGANDSWNNVLGDAFTDRDASWEIVFRPGDYTGTHTLFNTGGNGDGLAFVLDGSILDFRFQDDDSATQRALAKFDLSTLDAEGDVFFHVVALADLDNPGNEGTATLWINGVLRDTGTSAAGGGGIDDWDGGDDAELGTGNNIPGSSSFGPDPFDGDIAIFNYYDNILLDASVIVSNYNALAPTPAALPAGLLLLTAMGTRRRRR